MHQAHAKRIRDRLNHRSPSRRIGHRLDFPDIMDTSTRPDLAANRAALLAVVCGGAIMGLALGIRHVQGLFLMPMTMDRGWSREAFGFAIALQNLCWGLAQPVAGMVADRFGSMRVVAAGTLLYGAGLVAMSQATGPAGLALGAGLLIGCAQSCTTFGAVYAAISRIVAPARRSQALGIAGALGGLGQFAMVPLAQGLQQWLGWSSALVALGTAIALLLPAARALDDAGAQAGAAEAVRGQSMRAALREALAHRGFWLLNAGFLACGFQLAFIASHLPAYLLDHGLAPRDAVAGLAAIALGNIAGTYAFGVWGGRHSRKRLLAGIYLARSAAMALFLLVPLSAASTWIFCAAMGTMWLGTVPLTSGLVSGVFGVRWIGTLFGFVFFGHQLGASLGVWLGGAVFDRTHSYNPVWVVAMCLGVVAAGLHLMIDERPVGDRRLAGAGA
jgi:MFS family permease